MCVTAIQLHCCYYYYIMHVIVRKFFFKIRTFRPCKGVDVSAFISTRPRLGKYMHFNSIINKMLCCEHNYVFKCVLTSFSPVDLSPEIRETILLVKGIVYNATATAPNRKQLFERICHCARSYNSNNSYYTNIVIYIRNAQFIIRFSFSKRLFGF